MRTTLGQFDEVSYVTFMEAALEHYDFQTCQRSDGSYYGTGGTCRKGTPAEKPEKEKKGKKPVDSGSMGKMSDGQLKQLAGRKELDTAQKAAISKEMQDRKNASLNAGGMPGQDSQTKAAQAGTDSATGKNIEKADLEANEKRLVKQDIKQGLSPRTEIDKYPESSQDKVLDQWEKDKSNIINRAYPKGARTMEQAEKDWETAEVTGKVEAQVKKYVEKAYGGKLNSAQVSNITDAIINDITEDADQGGSGPGTMGGPQALFNMMN